MFDIVRLFASCVVALIFILPGGLALGGLRHDPTESHMRFPAAPVCPFRSKLFQDRRFYDAHRNLCVWLDMTDIQAPMSAPCPPGSGRRLDEFLCRGDIYTGFEIKCRHSSDTLPTRPFWANQDYQCIKALAYVPRPKRCPEGFHIKKLIDRWGTTPGRLGTQCVSTVSRPAEVLEIDPIVLQTCKLLPDFYNQTFFEEQGLPLPRDVDDDSWLYDTAGEFDRRNFCARVATNKVVKCPQEGHLTRRPDNSGWDCVTKVHVGAEMDPVGCKKRFFWSGEFQTCMHIEAYTPPKRCPGDWEPPGVRHSGQGRKQRLSPRYYGDSTDPNRCLVDTALPDNPFCPEGWWLEWYRPKRHGVPRCIREYTQPPSYSCASVEGSIMEVDLATNDPICVIKWDDSMYVPGPAYPSKRQKMNSKSLLKKPAAAPSMLETAFEDLKRLSVGATHTVSSEMAWEEAIGAALDLLEPVMPTNSSQFFGGQD